MKDFERNILLTGSFFVASLLQGCEQKPLPSLIYPEATSTVVINGTPVADFPYYFEKRDEIIANPPPLENVDMELIRGVQRATGLIFPIPDSKLLPDGSIDVSKLNVLDPNASGFFADDGFFYTAKHVFTNLDGEVSATHAIVFYESNQPGKINAINVGNVTYQKGYDVVRIAMPPGSGLQQLSIGNRRPEVGETVLIAGRNPSKFYDEQGKGYSFPTRSFRGEYVGNDIQGGTEFIIRTGIETGEVTNPEGGWSGGPVVDPDTYKVIGMTVTGSNSKDDGLLVKRVIGIDLSNTVDPLRLETAGPFKIMTASPIPNAFPEKLKAGS